MAGVVAWTVDRRSELRSCVVNPGAAKTARAAVLMELLPDFAEFVFRELAVIEILRERAIGIVQRMSIRQLSELIGIDNAVFESAPEEAAETVTVIPALQAVTELFAQLLTLGFEGRLHLIGLILRDHAVGNEVGKDLFEDRTFFGTLESAFVGGGFRRLLGRGGSRLAHRCGDEAAGDQYACRRQRCKNPLHRVSPFGWLFGRTITIGAPCKQDV